MFPPFNIELKLMEAEQILTIVVSALTGATAGTIITGLINLIISIIKTVHDSKDKKNEEKRKEKCEYYILKKDAYLKALKYLQYFKSSFKITKQNYSRNPENRRKVDEAYSKIDDAYALIRLYSSEKVFNLFNAIYTNYRKFSFPDEQGWRLGETEEFDFLVMLLSRTMNEDLGYKRIDNEKVLEIKCPNCHTKHKIHDECPKCNMTIFETVTKINAIIRKGIDSTKPKK